MKRFYVYRFCRDASKKLIEHWFEPVILDKYHWWVVAENAEQALRIAQHAETRYSPRSLAVQPE